MAFLKKIMQGTKKVSYKGNWKESQKVRNSDASVSLISLFTSLLVYMTKGPALEGIIPEDQGRFLKEYL